MLKVAEIRQLSDKDIAAELSAARDLLFRQKMIVKTGHSKASHVIAQLKSFVARLLTVSQERKDSGEIVEKSDSAASKKMAEFKKGLTAEEKKPAKKAATKKAEK